MDTKTATLEQWAEYAKQRYPSSVRSWQQAHSSFDMFVRFAKAQFVPSGNPRPSQMTTSLMARYRDTLVAASLSPSTINTRLSYAKRMLDIIGEHVKFEPITVPYVTRTKPRKWWLTEERWADLKLWLMACKQQDMIDYIEWTLETGLRVEETLRLLPSDFTDSYTTLIVPGTKTEGSAVRLPISKQATQLILNRLSRAKFGEQRIFDIPYHTLRRKWEDCRTKLGVADNPTSTLKSLRRSFAGRCLLDKDMSAPMIQGLLRHTDIQTTMSYLRLVGLMDNPQTRAKLDGGRPPVPVWGKQLDQLMQLDEDELIAFIVAVDRELR